MQPDLILAGGFTRHATTEHAAPPRLPRRNLLARPILRRHPRATSRASRLLLGPQRPPPCLAAFDRAPRRSQPAANSPPKSAALYYANNYTSGRGTLASRHRRPRRPATTSATTLGLDGMVNLPLELLVITCPDLIIAEQRDSDRLPLPTRLSPTPPSKADRHACRQPSSARTPPGPAARHLRSGAIKTTMPLQADRFPRTAARRPRPARELGRRKAAASRCTSTLLLASCWSPRSSPLCSSARPPCRSRCRSTRSSAAPIPPPPS